MEVRKKEVILLPLGFQYFSFPFVWEDCYQIPDTLGGGPRDKLQGSTGPLSLRGGGGALGRERVVPGSSSCVGLVQTAGPTRSVVLCCVRGGRQRSGLHCADGSRGAR